jgi:hypothetical protein
MKLTIKDRIEIAFWNFRYYIRKFTNPQHKSLRKAIPREWRDLDGIIEDFLSAAIISFVEEENGLDQIKMIEDYERASTEKLISDFGSVEYYNQYRNLRLPIYKRLEEIYKWVKSGKKAMQNYLQTIEGTSNWKEYGKVEHDIYERDTEYLADLVKLRKYLWT